MPLSVLLNSLPLPFEEAVCQAGDMGFEYVDVVAWHDDRPETHRAALAEAGVVVACAALGKGLPDGYELDGADVSRRRDTVELYKRHIADAAALGASHGYLVAGTDASPAGLTYFTEACRLLADHAAQRHVRLCVEHVPGRALPNVAAALAWLATCNHPNVYLLLDIGHCLISDENPARAIAQAGPRLGYIHLDDNDGVRDIHLPLLHGQLTEEDLSDVFRAARRLAHTVPLCLELNPDHVEPVANLRASAQLCRRLWRECT
ncbi:MAG: sugar phosphate isomerase/epimerase family protein [Gemmataceae bacterium]